MVDEKTENATDGLAARRAALSMVNGAVIDGRSFSDARELARLAPAEAARAGRLANETLRWAQRSDRVLGPYLRNKPYDHVLNAMRLAVFEMLGDGAAPHGAVGAAVSLIKEISPRHAGLTNAVLRKVAAAPPDWGALPLPELPKWLRKLLVAAYGKAAVLAIEAAHAQGAALDLTPKTGDPSVLAGTVGGLNLPTGSVRVPGAPQVTGLPGYDGGAWWVQDAAAALPTKVLAPTAGERVLDLCAAPGGKTMQVAADGAKVTALDLSEDRMGRVAENLSRVGLTADLVVADALEWTPAAPFDAVLLDAPCSATGTIRRHPELPFIRTPADVTTLAGLQARLIDRALDMLAPGGRMVFCTCSLLPDEGEAQVTAALERNPGVFADTKTALPAGVDPGWLTVEGGLRLRPDYWPDLGGMDGFYIARLRKPA